MTTLLDAVNEWHERVRRDLAPFADPGTLVDTVVDGRMIRASWVMRGERRDATFMVNLGTIEVLTQGETLAYRAFFAGPAMADLGGLAKMILQATPQRVFVETPAIAAEDDISHASPATQLLEQTLSEGKLRAATSVIIVTGDAGAGKTSVLQELVRLSADNFIHGQSDYLLLYVNAQGRALARLDEALATELSDLRARLTYHAVPTLTRLGLIVPVIDGFDELLGVSGYDEAFSSLSRFVEDLDGEGQIIASARSTYYEQEFVARANTVSSLGSQIWHQIPIRVLEWGVEQVDQYIQARCQQIGFADSYGDLRRSFDRAFAGENAALKNKPFFVARVFALVAEGEEFDEHGQLLELLVRAYVEREITKLRGRSGEGLLEGDQITSLLIEVAEEMWNQESRELDRRSTKDVAEFVLASFGISETVQRYVIERMPAMAFLTPGSRPGNVTFEHESFFAFFLGRRLAERMTSDPIRLHGLLGRSTMPEDVAENAARFFVQSDKPDARQIVDKLSDSATIESTRTMQVRENAGLTAAAMLRSWCAVHGELENVEIRNLTFPGADMSGVRLLGVAFTDVEFRRVDLTHTQFLSARFTRGLMQDVAVDPEVTRLEFDAFDVATQIFGLRVATATGVAPVFDPVRVRQVLAKCGVPVELSEPIEAYSVREDIVQIVERISRAYRRSNPISINQDDEKTATIEMHLDWPRVEQLLIETGVVRLESKNTSGAKKRFLRRQVRAEEIAAGLDPSIVVSPAVRTFWRQLAAEFPAK